MKNFQFGALSNLLARRATQSVLIYPAGRHPAQGAVLWLHNEQTVSIWSMMSSEDDFCLVQVTNDGVHYSNSRVLTLYDALCQLCQFHPTALCQLKVI